MRGDTLMTYDHIVLKVRGMSRIEPELVGLPVGRP